MKSYVVIVLIIMSWLPAAGQRSSYDPAAKQPGKPRDGFVDFAIKQINYLKMVSTLSGPTDIIVTGIPVCCSIYLV